MAEYSLANYYQNQLNRLYNPRPRRQREGPAFPPLEEEDEQRMLSWAARQGLSGLAYLGQSLDKAFGGRAVRGILGGKAREALSLIPFSDALGITNPEDVVYGRDLLEKVGVLGKNQPGLDLGDVAGFVADVALDPASYVLPFAKTAAGRFAEKVGAKFPSGLARQIRGFEKALSPGAAKVAEKELLDIAEITGGASYIPPDVARAAKAAGVDLAAESRIGVKSGRAADVTPPNVWIPHAAAFPVRAQKVAKGALPSFEEAQKILAGGDLPPLGAYQKVVGPRSWSELAVRNPTNTTLPGKAALSQKQIVEKALGEATPLRGVLGVNPLPLGLNRLLGIEPIIFGANPKGARLVEAIGDGAGWIGKKLANAPFGIGTAASFAGDVGKGLGILGKALFVPSAQGSLIPEVQSLGKYVSEIEEPLIRTAAGSTYDIRRAIEPLIQRGGDKEAFRLARLAGEAPGRLPRTVTEYLQDAAARGVNITPEIQNNLNRAFGHFERFGNLAHSHMEKLHQAERALGLGTDELVDAVRYIPREHYPLAPGRMPGEGWFQYMVRRGRHVFDTGHSSQTKRKEMLRNFPGGTVQFEDMLKMKDAAGNPLLVARDMTLPRPQARAMSRQARTIIREQLSGTARPPKGHFAWEQARQLEKYLKTLPKEYAETGSYYFQPDVVASISMRYGRSAKAQAGAQGIYEGIRRLAKHESTFGDQATMKVHDLLTKSGLTATDQAGASISRKIAAKKLGLASVDDLKNYALPEDIARDMMRFVTPWTRPHEMAPILAAFDKYTNLFKGWLTAPFPAFHSRNFVEGLFQNWRDDALSFSAMDDTAKILNGIPDVAALPGMKVKNPIEIMNAIVREAVQGRAAFVHGAHRTSDISAGAIQDLPRISGKLPGRASMAPERIFDSLREAARPASDFVFNVKTTEQVGDILKRFSRGGKAPVNVVTTPNGFRVSVKTYRVDDVLKRLGMDTPTEIASLAQARGITTSQLRAMRIAEANLGDIVGATSGEAVRDWFKGWKTGYAREGSLNPLNVAGVREGGDINVLMAQMRQLGNMGEDFIRLSHYIAKRRQGFSPEVAAAAVRKYHIDYTKLTPFERSVAKRAMPWYSFTRGVLPPVLEDLATKPAKLAASIRLATTGVQNREGFAPPYLAENVAIPLPGASEGYARYLSSLGMPFEDESLRALSTLVSGDAGRAAGILLGQSNPLIKLPIESATGVQLHTGRKLEDLRPSWPGNFLGYFNEDYARPFSQIISSTPASRFVSSTEKLLDTLPGGRKGVPQTALNLLTGMRITDVDVERAKDIAAREMSEEMLRHRPGVSEFKRIYARPGAMDEGLLSPIDIALLRLQSGIEKRAKMRAATLR